MIDGQSGKITVRDAAGAISAAIYGTSGKIKCRSLEITEPGASINVATHIADLENKVAALEAQINALQATVDLHHP